MALYCPLPGQYSAIARQETTRREEAEDRRRKKVREGGREKKEAGERSWEKRLLSLLLFTLHQIVWNPDKHWGSERWRVGSPLHHSSPLFTSSLSQPQSKTEAGHHRRPKLVTIEDQSWSSLKAEAGHHWRPKLVTIEGRRPKPDSREDLASSKKIRVKSGWRVVKSWGNSSPEQAPYTQ